MLTRFETLFTLAVSHEYYSGVCPDFQFQPSAAAAALARRGRLLLRQRDHVLYCLYEATSPAVPRVDISGARLVLGMQLRAPYFANYSDYSFTDLTPLYRNQGAPATLDAPLQRPLLGELLHQPLSAAERPLSVTLRNEAGDALRSVELGASAQQGSVDFDLRGLPPGLYEVQEQYPGDSFSSAYLVDPELLQRGVFAVLMIDIDSSFYAAPPAFSIPFSASASPLKYYVVTSNYSENEFDSLALTDQGFSDDDRAQISFSRVAANAFGADDPAPDLLHSGTQKLVLFQSTAAQKRRQRPRTRLQLQRNGEVLIPNLPTPGADRPRQDWVIYLEKP